MLRHLLWFQSNPTRDFWSQHDCVCLFLIKRWTTERKISWYNNATNVSAPTALQREPNNLQKLQYKGKQEYNYTTNTYKNTTWHKVVTSFRGAEHSFHVWTKTTTYFNLPLTHNYIFDNWHKHCCNKQGGGSQFWQKADLVSCSWVTVIVWVSLVESFAVVCTLY